MEIKILVKENEKVELYKFIKTCKEHGMKLTREGRGRLPNFSGYYAAFEGVRWEKADTSESNCNIPIVNARTFKIGEKVQWRGMELFVVEIGVNELLIATDMNPNVENYNDWWVGVQYVR